MKSVIENSVFWSRFPCIELDYNCSSQVGETSLLEETRNQLEHAISQAKRPEEVNDQSEQINQLGSRKINRSDS